jgi:hypothetical protein
MKFNSMTEDAARRASAPRKLLRPGWHDATIKEAVEKPDRHGQDMIELGVVVGETTLRDWLTSHEKGQAKLRSCCVAVSALDAYEVEEVSQDLFPGHDVQVKISVEKRRGFPDQNRIDEYRAASASSVVTFSKAV